MDFDFFPLCKEEIGIARIDSRCFTPNFSFLLAVKLFKGTLLGIEQSISIKNALGCSIMKMEPKVGGTSKVLTNRLLTSPVDVLFFSRPRCFCNHF